MGDQSRQKKLYQFLVERLQDQAEFSREDAGTATGWQPSALKTYWSKQLKGYLRKNKATKKFKVRRSFARFGTFDDFQPLVTQNRNWVSRYTRSTYEAIVSYEFLLPLTQEGKLRTALDELFYRDTIEAIVRDLVDDNDLEQALPRQPGETDDAHVVRAIEKIGDLFGGYSISHVSGRFRAARTATRRDVAEQLIRHQRYLVDETTAVVRFIFPCVSTRQEHGKKFDVTPSSNTTLLSEPKLKSEVQLIRGLFFAVFVDAVVTSVQGEDIIWLLEDSPFGRRLYELGRATQENRDGAQGSEDDEDDRDEDDHDEEKDKD